MNNYDSYLTWLHLLAWLEPACKATGAIFDQQHSPTVIMVIIVHDCDIKLPGSSKAVLVLHHGLGRGSERREHDCAFYLWLTSRVIKKFRRWRSTESRRGQNNYISNSIKRRLGMKQCCLLSPPLCPFSSVCSVLIGKCAGECQGVIITVAYIYHNILHQD